MVTNQIKGLQQKRYAQRVTREEPTDQIHLIFCSEYYWTLHLMHRPVHPKSFYEWKTGSIEDRKFSP